MARALQTFLFYPTEKQLSLQDMAVLADHFILILKKEHLLTIMIIFILKTDIKYVSLQQLFRSGLTIYSFFCLTFISFV